MSKPTPQWQPPRFIDPTQLDREPAPAGFEPAREIPPEQVTTAPVPEADSASRPTVARPSLIRRLFTLTAGVLLTGIVTLELYRLLEWSYNLHPILAGLTGTLIFLLLGSGIWQLHQSLKGSRQLRRIELLRDQARRLTSSQEQRHAARFIHQLERHYTHTPALESLRQSIAQLDSAYNDSEIIQFLSTHALRQQDEQARRCVRRYSIESGVLVALSPWASFDMLLVGWRNLRMLREIARIYGIAPGVATQWKLFRRVLHNIAFAGLSEVAMDAGSAWIGTTLTSAISARTGQGIGAGLFTARTGQAAIELCRPLPKIESDSIRPQEIATAITERINPQK